MRITLVTTTHNRPHCWPLLTRWIERQTIEAHQWIIVDDGDQAGAYPNWAQVVRRPAGPAGRQSFAGNWAEALRHVAGDLVVPVEDDDWYHPEYLAWLVRFLGDDDLAGVSGECYYQVPMRRWVHLDNIDNASLAAMCWRSRLNDAVAALVQVVRTVYLDVAIWGFSYIRRWKSYLATNRAPDGRCLHVGCKGMPGPGGLGWCHDGQPGLPDPHGEVLDYWVGPEDAAAIRAVAELASKADRL